MAELDIDMVLQKLEDDWWKEKTMGVPSDDARLQGSLVRAQPDANRSGFKVYTYFKWFDCSGHAAPLRFWFQLSNKEHIHNVAQFRLGSHWLNIETERFAASYVPRSSRVCKCCQSGGRDDELHMMTGCAAYNDIRCRFHKLFGHMANSGEPSEHVDQTMKALNNVPGSGVDAKDFWKEMAIFLSKCKALHNQRNGNYTLGLAASPTATGA